MMKKIISTIIFFYLTCPYVVITNINNLFTVKNLDALTSDMSLKLYIIYNRAGDVKTWPIICEYVGAHMGTDATPPIE